MYLAEVPITLGALREHVRGEVLDSQHGDVGHALLPRRGPTTTVSGCIAGAAPAGGGGSGSSPAASSDPTSHTHCCEMADGVTSPAIGMPSFFAAA